MKLTEHVGEGSTGVDPLGVGCELGRLGLRASATAPPANVAGCSLRSRPVKPTEASRIGLAMITRRFVREQR